MRKNHIITILYIALGLINFANVSQTQGQEENAVQTDLIESPAGERLMKFYAVHRQTKEPLSDVALTIRVTADNYKRQESWDETTDSKGFCKITLPDFQIETLRLYPEKEGFVPLFIMWRGIPTPPELPRVFTVAMEPSTTIGGVVQDERGEPIEGVAVGVHYQTAEPDAAENVYVDIMIHNALETDIKTDKAGRWTFDKMPAEIDKNELRIFLKHPRYLSDQLRPGFIPMPITRQPSIESLRDLNAVMVMKEGLKVTVKITDKRGMPVAGAKIFDMEDYWWRSTKPFAETDVQGQFQSNANPGTATWTVQAPGYAPDLRVVTIKAGMSPVEFRLGPGRTIQGKVTDRAGQPIKEAWISAEDWRKNKRRLHLVAQTDADGNFKVTDAPADEVTFDIGKEGFMALENYPMKSGKDKYTITLRPTLKVRGTVLNALTGQPISKFTVTNGFDHEDGRAPQWDKHSIRTFTDGQYEMEYMQEIFTYRIRIDADGYQSAVSDGIRPSEIRESMIIRDFKLDKASLLAGVVLSPEGTSMSDADVVIATHQLRVINGKIDSRSSENNLILHTDTHGKFHFEPPVSLYAIVVLSEKGYTKVTPDEFAAIQTITLSAWGQIEGTLRIGTQPGVDKLITFFPKSNQEQEQPNIYFEYEAQTEENGNFTFLHVLPGKGTIARAILPEGSARHYSHHIDVEVKTGQIIHIQIGGTGRPVVGKIIIPDMIRNIFDWQYTYGSLRISSPIDPPYKILGVEFNQNGSFRTDDVPAGEYCLYVQAYGPPPNTRSSRGERIGELSRVFSIPEMPGGRSDEPLDLGELELEVIGKSAFIPSLIGKPLPDLAEMNLAPALEQADDHMILLCFFDMNQRPSRHCLTQLAKQVEPLKDKGIIVVAVQASKVEQNALDEWAKKYNVPFPVGMIQGDEEKTRFAWGVRSLPWLILTDNSHVVVSQGFPLGDLDKQLEQGNP